MSKNLLAALIMIGVVMVILIVNTTSGVLSSGKITVNLVFTSVDALRSVVFFAFLAWGVAIGVLLR
jgi:hypothetical protein